MLKVPIVDLAGQYLSLKSEIDEAMQRVLASGNHVAGQEVEAFEEEWAAFCGQKYCVATSSGTDAIYLALEGIKHEAERNGDPLQVAVPDFTFIGTVEPAVRAGYLPVLYDVEWDTGIMGMPAPHFKGIVMPVSIFGQKVSWAGSSYFTIVEDAAQGHGNTVDARISCFSFYPTKNLGAVGMAGALVTNDDNVASRARRMRVHGEVHHSRFNHRYLSGNYRMDELQAAILRVKLPHLKVWNERREAIANVYYRRLGMLLNILPINTAKSVFPSSSWHIYPVRTSDPGGLASFLEARGVQTARRYPTPMHKQPALDGRFAIIHNDQVWRPGRDTAFDFGKHFNWSIDWCDQVLNLPIHEMMTLDQAEYVADMVAEYFS